MKVLIILALAVAAVSAGFSGTLNQQTRPLVNGAISKIRSDLAAKVPARNSAEVGFQTAFVDAIATQVGNVIEQIDNAVTAVEAISQSIVSSFHAAVEQGQNLVSSAIEGGQQIIGGLISNVLGALFGGGNGRAGNLSPFLIGIIQSVAQNPAFVNLVHESGSYKCMQENGVEVTYEYIRNLYYSDQLNANLLQDPVIDYCVQQAGGLEALISGSAVVDMASGMANSLGIASMIDAVIIQVVGPELGNMIINAINARGFFGDIFGAVGNAASNVWDAVSNTAVNAWNGVTDIGQYIAGVAVETVNSAFTTFEVVKQLAVAFIQGGIHTAYIATQEAAQNFVDFLTPFAQDLGVLYDQTISQLTSMWDGLTIPSWQARQAIRG